MFQLFSRSVRKANRILDIGFVTPDTEVGRQLKDFVSSRDGVDLRMIESAKVLPGFDAGGLSVFVYDLDSTNSTSMSEFERFMRQRPQQLPVIVLSPSVDDELVRWFLRLKVSDWVKSPLSPGELISACGRVIDQPGSSRSEVNCMTFIGARGGAGATTVAIEAAFLAAKNSRGGDAACIVDLDFSSGSCAEYLDLQPGWQLDEIISDPVRLDARMLDVMTARHKQGISVLSAYRKLGKSFDFSPEAVTRTLDLASQKFQNIVIDLPRHFETWTDGVLLGSSHVFVVTDFSVPGLKSARRMINEIRDLYSGEVKPRAIVNKYSRSMFGSGLSASEVKEILRDDLAGYLPSEDMLVREAIDRGVPLGDVRSRNAITSDLAKIIGSPT